MQVRCVPLATLNPSRLELLIERYLQQAQGQEQQQHVEPIAQQQQQPGHHACGLGSSSSRRQHGVRSGPVLPTPSELAALDPVFHAPRVRVGTPLHKLVQHIGGQLGELGALLRQQQGQQQGQQPQPLQQLEREPPGQRHLLVPASGCMHLLLHEQAGSADCILGFVHAYLVQHCQNASSSSEGSSSSSRSNDCSPSTQPDLTTAGISASAQHQQPQQPPQLQQHCEWQQGGGSSPGRMQESLAEARRLLPGLLAALEAAGWDDEKVVLEAKRRRVTW